jgi:hypothetical protein
MFDAGMGVSIAGVMAAAAMKVHYGRMLTLVEGGVAVDTSTANVFNKIELGFSQDVEPNDASMDPNNYEVKLKKPGESSLTVRPVASVDRESDRIYILNLEGNENLIPWKYKTDAKGNELAVVDGELTVEPKNLTSKFGLAYSDDQYWGGGYVGGVDLPIKGSPQITKVEKIWSQGNITVFDVRFSEQISSLITGEPIVTTDFKVALRDNEAAFPASFYIDSTNGHTTRTRPSDNKQVSNIELRLTSNIPLTAGTLVVAPVANKLKGATGMKLLPDDQQLSQSSVNLAS